MKNKRGTDHNWQIIRYKDDICLYARCKCGFDYACSINKRKEDGTLSFIQEVVPNKIYPYCPYCGAKKKTYDSEVTKLDKNRWKIS